MRSKFNKNWEISLTRRSSERISRVWYATASIDNAIGRSRLQCNQTKSPNSASRYARSGQDVRSAHPKVNYQHQLDNARCPMRMNRGWMTTFDSCEFDSLRKNEFKQALTSPSRCTISLSGLAVKQDTPFSACTQASGVRTDTQRGMLPGLSRERKMRSKIWWFTEFCNSHYVSQFAAFFIDTRA